ncbi:response regulator transcription factor [Streptomyces iconiensis]|uniref:Response regulator transcription factor n=1 Tax=Streptomyces iconiensis TaxID=1384038 RepID=A0ABT7A0X5_9ACTN|nr:response regulator transcription factor [Streptomyces iconiensis]MDJ1134985.1 response regulator transcription factor [Streptomyces iconiensis]
MLPVRTVVVSDNALLADAVIGLLEAHSDIAAMGYMPAEEATAHTVAGLMPDLFLLMGSSQKLASTARALRGAAPATRILAMVDGEGTAREELARAGVDGFLPCDGGRRQLLLAILRTPARPPAVSGPAALTGRELQVLRYTAVSMTNRQIASELGVSIGTVKRHLHSVFQKLGAVSRLDAVTRALAAGILAKAVGLTGPARATGGVLPPRPGLRGAAPEQRAARPGPLPFTLCGE